ncbi:MAG: hypothetical protein VZS44_04985 [Bacilli bacterium]|nr:hypothetical protein [Bacilli bacterium]
MKYLKLEDFIKQIEKQFDVEQLKQQFKNVYFIIGTAYAGKSTMIKMLTDEYDGIMCEENYGLKYLDEYGVNSIEHPCLCYTNNHSMVDFVNRTPDEYYNWLRGSEMEITPIEINELIKLTNSNPNEKIFVDTSIPLEILKLISDYNNLVVMLSDPSMSIDRFFDRSDYEKQIIFHAIKHSKDSDATMINYRKCLEKANSQERYNYYLNSGLYCFKRDDSLTLDQTMSIISKHFKLDYKVIKK